MNKITVSGRLVRDVEVKTSKSGEVAYLRNTIAVRAERKGEEDQFFDFIVFGKLASEVIGKFCDKGSFIILEGSLQRNKYTTDLGETRYTYNIVASNVELVSSNPKNKTGIEVKKPVSSKPAPKAPKEKYNSTEPSEVYVEEDTTIPF